MLHEGSAPRPLQLVRRGVELPWSERDWSALDEAGFAARLEGFLAEDRGRGFDFTAGPLLRVALLQGADERQVVVASHHHLILDGWSQGRVIGELLQAYAALRRGAAPGLPAVPPPVAYAGWLARQDRAVGEAFWRDQLAGLDGPFRLALPAPAAEAAGTAAAMGEHKLALPAGATARLQAFARRHRLTLNTLVQGAWAILLARYSGKREVVFGATVAGRPGTLVDAERMVGLFINTLPVRARVDEAAALVTWLVELQAAMAEAQAHGHCSLAEIQRWAGTPGGEALFDTLTVYENYPLDAALQDGSALTGLGFAITGSRTLEQTNYPLALAVLPGAALTCRFAFDPGRVEPSLVVQIGGHLSRLFEGIAAADPATPVSALPLLGEAERDRLLVAWNATAAPVAATTLPALFAAQAARTPEATALVFEGAHLTYAELEQAANRLAHRLLAHGVGPGTIVGVCLERSFELLVGLLGVMTAGAAYLPLEPSHPPARLRLMAEDAGVGLVLASRTTAGQAHQAAATLLLLDDPAERAALAALPTTAPGTAELGRPLLPDDLAYVIYTSGSTGTPKGVAVAHRGVVNRILWGQDRYRLTPADRVVQKTPFSFDVSVWELFWPLLVGARLVIARPEGHEIPPTWSSSCARRRSRWCTSCPRCCRPSSRPRSRPPRPRCGSCCAAAKRCPARWVMLCAARCRPAAAQSVRPDRGLDRGQLPSLHS